MPLVQREPHQHRIIGMDRRRGRSQPTLVLRLEVSWLQTANLKRSRILKQVPFSVIVIHIAKPDNHHFSSLLDKEKGDPQVDRPFLCLVISN